MKKISVLVASLVIGLSFLGCMNPMMPTPTQRSSCVVAKTTNPGGCLNPHQKNQLH